MKSTAAAPAAAAATATATGVSLRDSLTVFLSNQAPICDGKNAGKDR